MFRRTIPRARLASTKHGMRRILKQKGTVSEYIRQATESGTYRTNEELERVWRERRESADDLRVVMRRFRQDIVRGTAIQDYPVEYQILMQHPPVPDPPRTPKKLLKKMPREPNPVEGLVKRYMQRQEDRNASASSAKNSSDSNSNTTATTTTTAATAEKKMSSDEYYRRILGIPAHQQQHGVALKSAAVQKAYDAAIHHYRLQRTTEGLTDEQAMQQVDEILQQQAHEEKVRSRARAAAVKSVQATASVDDSQKEAEVAAGQESAQKAADGAETSAAAAANETTVTSATLETVLGSPRTVEAMMRWSERLMAVPYTDWTVGASTALDHWIARQVLQLSEETWLTLLEGSDPDLLEQGREIVAVREALFPETHLHTAAAQDQVASMTDGPGDQDGETDASSSDEKSVEELLASLGALYTPTTTPAPAENMDDLDAQVTKLMDQLQDYRRHHAQTPYEEWSKSEKDSLNQWIQLEYVPVLAAGRNQKVDVSATRQALLSVPPTAADHVFWNRLVQIIQGDESLLESLLADETYSHLFPSDFLKLPVAEQMERLSNLQALRPLLDDYALESERQAFVQRHAQDLLRPVPLEHLIPDPEGPIAVSDLPPELAQGLPPSARFRLELQSKERTEAWLLLWNLQKSGRAQYEERLFRTGRLGLRYSDPIPEE